MSSPHIGSTAPSALWQTPGATVGSPDSSTASAVAWGAILAGAAAAAALSLILLVLGTGLGLSAVSPWANNSVSARSFGWSTIAWVTITQLLASGFGGYLAGRLRTKWVDTHGDEVYFRDTAHGFLSWAIASLATAALLGSVLASVVGGGMQAAATVAAAGADGMTAAGAALAKSDVEAGRSGSSYLIESLFRKSGGTPAAAGAAPVPVAEVGAIFMNSIRSGSLPTDDLRYVGQLVAQHSGLSVQDAERRVADTYNRAQIALRTAQTTAKEATDAGRKASSRAALWLFISLLSGAFVASLAATFGGRQRDL